MKKIMLLILHAISNKMHPLILILSKEDRNKIEKSNNWKNKIIKKNQIK